MSRRVPKCNYCSCPCSVESSAAFFLETYSDIMTSGGPSVGAARYLDYDYFDCNPSFYQGIGIGNPPTAPSFPGFDFSSALITSLDGHLFGSPVGSIRTASHVPGSAELGVRLEGSCYNNTSYRPPFPFNQLVVRGLGFARIGFGPAGLVVASFLPTIAFDCGELGEGPPSYVMSLSVQVITVEDLGLVPMQPNPSTGWYNPPLYEGVDWTAEYPPSSTIYSRNGNTTRDGAIVTVGTLGNLSNMSWGSISAMTWASYPTTSFSMWLPDPVVDWTSLTHRGTVSLV